jgi:CBS domain-containing protein
VTESMNAGEICNRIVVVASRDTPLGDAARRMREQHVGCLVVVDDTGAGRLVVGMLTDRDIVTAVVARGVAPQTLRVEDVMSTDVVTIGEATSFAEVLSTMRRKGLRRLPVVDAKGMLLGLVTLDDALEILAEQMHTLTQAVESEQFRERKARH